ncbi:FtsX-like permease family protein [Actinomadura namibiensis]|uniref:Putative ABC transport system permease protein n=1 Tax=Actinomadura namibiensis TaxID=182080 RepID=A0A7W3QRB6_ACTNM|nr:FtsX-like permease family protein [Actinomadura namibiensis]MBA8956620.1 putative ABC transport system permease protein [Actinomadura namibiensis]
MPASERSALALDRAALDQRTRVWRTLMPPAVRAVVDRPETVVALAESRPDPKAPHSARLLPTWSPEVEARVRYVAGTAPATGDDGTVALGLSKTVADRLGYTVGSRFALVAGEEPRIHARISGLYEAADPADPFWRAHRPALRTERRVDNRTGMIWEAAEVLFDEAALARLAADGTRAFTYTWRYPVAADRVTAERAARVPADLQALGGRLPAAGVGGAWRLDSGLGDLLGGYTARARTAEVLLGLAFSGLIAVMAGALLLTAGLFTERLRPALALMRARGASLPQLARTACGPVVLAAAPAAALGHLAGRWLGAGPPQPVSVAAAAGLAALAVVPAVLAVREHAGPPRPPGRPDLATARPSRRRLVAEALAVALAVIAVVLARRRGPAGQAAPGGWDPFVVAVPALLGVAVALLVLRASPFPLRALTRLARRGRGTVAFVGLARVSRGHAVAVLPLTVLLLAVTVAGFSTAVRNTLHRGQERVALHEVGADARVFSARLEADAVDRLRRVPGVTGAVGARATAGCTLSGGGADGLLVTVVAVDLDAYRRVAGRTAASVPPAPGRPDGALLSREVAAVGSTGQIFLECGNEPRIGATAAGRFTEFPGLPPGTPAVIVPMRLLGGAQAVPSQVFLSGDRIDAAALRAAAAAVTPETLRDGEYLRTRADTLRKTTDGPLMRTVSAAFRHSVLTAAAYGMLTVVLLLAVGARARSRAVAHLQALGLGRRQRRALAVLEIAPVLLCSAAGGWALGLALPAIVGPLADLRPYTGGLAVPASAPDPLATAVLGGALLAAAALAAAVDAAFDARHRLGTVLRTGE